MHLDGLTRRAAATMNGAVDVDTDHLVEAVAVERRDGAGDHASILAAAAGLRSAQT